MPGGVTLTPELANILREMARLYRANGWPSGSTQQETRFYPPDSIIFVNRSGEEIPAYGCMQVTGSIEQDGRTIFEVSKPDAATLTSENQLLFNSSRPVADDENGVAQPTVIVKALKDSGETTDDVGEGWNYTDGEWYLSPSGSFTYYGVSEIDDDVIIVKSPGSGSSIKHVYPPSGGIPAATWSAVNQRMTPGQGSCRVAEKVAGQYRPTTDTVMVENPVGIAVGISGKPMTIGKNTSGAWTVLVEDCSGSGTGGPLPPVEPDPEDPINEQFNLSLGLGL